MSRSAGSGRGVRDAADRTGRRGRRSTATALVFLLAPLAGAGAPEATLPGAVVASRGLGAPATARAAHAYLDGPPAGHTGGFGEPTCRTCHFDAPLNEPPGELSIDGLPRGLSGADAPVDVTVRLERDGLERGGFQLSARYAAGPAAGEQAGRFELPEPGTTTVAPGKVVYVGHTGPGTGASDDSLAWRIRWIPPGGSPHRVVVHVAANASNDDASEFGDHIYADSALVAPADGSSPR